MTELILDADEVERTRRRAAWLGQLILDDGWRRSGVSANEDTRHRAGPSSDPVPARPSPDGEGGPEPVAGLADATAAIAVVAAFPALGRVPGWTFGTYVLRDARGSYGWTFGRPLGTRVRSEGEWSAGLAIGRDPRTDADLPARMVLRWDEADLAGYLWASVAARELEQLGCDWHGPWWSSEVLLGGTGRPVIAGAGAAGAGPEVTWLAVQDTAPTQWDPRVRRIADGKTVVDLFTFGARGGSRLWHHRDVYPAGSRLADQASVVIAEAEPATTRHGQRTDRDG